MPTTPLKNRQPITSRRPCLTLYGVAIVALTGLLMHTSAFAQKRDVQTSSASRDQTIERGKERLWSVKNSMKLTPAQQRALQTIASQTDAEVTKRQRAINSSKSPSERRSQQKQLNQFITGKLDAVLMVLNPVQRKSIRAWQREMNNKLTTKPGGGDEGPLTALACVIICELACDDDEHCNCSYCSIFLPFPDP